ncbi:MAG: hypothetical protein LBH25_00015 [Fibromonadaceae bacterium]|jgi:hypothetical protein|nr:hypothetical protein [Fibromonadaceae bacterium]
MNDRFNYELEQQIDGSLPKGHIYKLGKPGQILRKAGIPDSPIELKADVLALKASQNYGHPFNLSEIKDLPNAIQDPIAIFAYGNKEKAVNIITEIESNGKNFLVGIALNPQVKGKPLDIHSIRTIFPKDIPEWKNWIDQGKALYVNEDKIGSLNNPRNPEDVNSDPTNKYTKFSEEAAEKSEKDTHFQRKGGGELLLNSHLNALGHGTREMGHDFPKLQASYVPQDKANLGRGSVGKMPVPEG